MNYLHNILARLYKNPLTDGINDLFARIKTNKSLTIRDICESAVARGGAAVSASLMEQIVRQWLSEMVYRAGDGFSVNAEWFVLSLRIKGTFAGITDHYDKERHRIITEFLETTKLRKYIEDNVSIVIEGMAEETARITQVKDAATGDTDSTITAGRNLFIYGDKIKVAGDHADVGIWFGHTTDAWTEKVPSELIVMNNPKEVQILVPPHFMANEAMTLTIRTQFSGSPRFLKEPRVISFDKILTTRSA